MPFHACELAHQKMGFYHLRLSLVFVTCLFAVFEMFDIHATKSAFDEDVEPLSLVGRSETTLMSLESSLGTNRNITIGKVSMYYGPTNLIYERALQLQAGHNEKFEYPMFVLREQTLPGYWSKPAHILQVLLSELAKSPRERLDWLFWVDADIVLMNPNIPLKIFLPPATSSFSNINLVATADHHGLNNGAFFLRVCPWSVQLFHTVLSLPFYHPDLNLRFGDQSAMSQLLSPQGPLGDIFANGTIYVPQRWFNAYAGYRGRNDHDPFSRPKRYTPNAVLEGDLQVHLAGGKSRREEFMTPFLDASEMHTERWEIPLQRTTYVKSREIERFWEREAARRGRGRGKPRTDKRR